MLTLCRQDGAVADNPDNNCNNRHQNNNPDVIVTNSQFKNYGDFNHVEGLSYKNVNSNDNLCPVKVVRQRRNFHQKNGNPAKTCYSSFSCKMRRMKGLVKRNWKNEFRHWE